MKKTVDELARYLGGELYGAPTIPIVELRSFGEASGGAICPLFSKKMLRLSTVLPDAVLATRMIAGVALEIGVQSAVVHDQPVIALARLIDLFYPEEPTPIGVHPTAVVDPRASVHPTAWIGPHAVVECGAIIGAYTRIGPNAVIAANCEIGASVQIGPGAVIGADGFGFIPTPGGLHEIRQVGRVVIEDGVEIGANTCIDRATLGMTRIGRETKIDNLVQIGHNARIGERVLLAGQVGLAGSTVIEDEAMLGGQVGVADHLVVGARVKIAAKSGVVGDIPDDGVYAGYPAVPVTKWRRAMAWLSRESAKRR